MNEVVAFNEKIPTSEPERFDRGREAEQIIFRT